MSPNAARYDEPHHVYWHYDDNMDLLYVGMTCEPDTRPYSKRGRPWLKDSFRCVVSPAMTHEAAAVVEREAMYSGRPKYNKRHTGQWVDEPVDPRIARLMEVEGCNKSTATYFVKYFSQDPEAFEAELAARQDKRPTTVEEAQARRADGFRFHGEQAAS